MVLCFFVSWPISIRKSWLDRSTRGKSVAFTAAVWVGYACGIAGKVMAGDVTYVLIFYVINLLAVSIDIGIYLRNLSLEHRAPLLLRGKAVRL